MSPIDRAARLQTPVLAVAVHRGSRATPPALLVVHPESQAGTAIQVDKEGVTLGREPSGAGPTFVVHGEGVSRSHAVVAAGTEGLSLRDLGSTNGSFVNGERVLERTLAPGDVVRLGDALLCVVRHLAEPADVDTLGLVGPSASLSSLRRLIRLAAPTAMPVLIMGPTGTGKELVARGVHDASRRRGAFVSVNCAAIPATLVESVLFGHRRGAFTDAKVDAPGAFVQADGGTLFLDEIGELPAEAQPKLLRALESGEVLAVGATRPVRVDARIVAATNQPAGVSGAVATLREDLHARLAGVMMSPAPLRDRREDILPLFRCFGGAARPMTAAFAEALLRYDWPRNVREVRRLAERLQVLQPDASRWDEGMLDPELLPRTPTPPRAAPSIEWPPASAEALQSLLDACGGNVSKAAERVGRNRKQLYRWMEKFDLHAAGDDEP